jgi:transcriptional regulator with XRE-family HTH domain
MKKRQRAAHKGLRAMDRVIGRRIRAEREAASLGQVALADAVGISFQQIQKCENGKDRVTAARLFETC